jgi:glycine C-acetyltransferase
MLFASAYTAVLSVITSLTTPETAIISDKLNHNCIINAIRLARPREKLVYRYLDLAQLDEALRHAAQTCRRAIVVTDGIFSMRGVHAPLDHIAELIARHDAAFTENVLLIVDDSHGIGAFGATGRGSEEYCGIQADFGNSVKPLLRMVAMWSDRRSSSLACAKPVQRTSIPTRLPLPKRVPL